MKAHKLQNVAPLLLGLLLCVPVEVMAASAQTAFAAGRPPGPVTTLWNRGAGREAEQTDVWFDNYSFRDHEKLDRLKLHYATLGAAHRDGRGEIDNAVLVLHWTAGDSRALLSETF